MESDGQLPQQVHGSRLTSAVYEVRGTKAQYVPHRGTENEVVDTLVLTYILERSGKGRGWGGDGSGRLDRQ